MANLGQNFELADFVSTLIIFYILIPIKFDILRKT